MKKQKEILKSEISKIKEEFKFKKMDDQQKKINQLVKKLNLQKNDYNSKLNTRYNNILKNMQLSKLKRHNKRLVLKIRNIFFKQKKKLIKKLPIIKQTKINEKKKVKIIDFEKDEKDLPIHDDVIIKISDYKPKKIVTIIDFEKDLPIHDDKHINEMVKKTDIEIDENLENVPQIQLTKKALRNYTKSYEVNINNNLDPREQLKNTEEIIKTTLETNLITMKGLKFIQVLKATLIKTIQKTDIGCCKKRVF